VTLAAAIMITSWKTLSIDCIVTLFSVVTACSFSSPGKKKKKNEKKKKEQQEKRNCTRVCEKIALNHVKMSNGTPGVCCG